MSRVSPEFEEWGGAGPWQHRPVELTRVCVFCGSNPGTDPAYVAEAEATGRALAERGIGLVYGGGSVGLMGRLAAAVMAAGGDVTGVIPEFLDSAEIAKRDITRLEVTSSMHERKARMAELSDAFVALPGGIGTFEEAFEAMTWTQLGVHDKPVGLVVGRRLLGAGRGPARSGRHRRLPDRRACAPASSWRRPAWRPSTPSPRGSARSSASGPSGTSPSEVEPVRSDSAHPEVGRTAHVRPLPASDGSGVGGTWGEAHRPLHPPRGREGGGGR